MLDNIKIGKFISKLRRDNGRTGEKFAEQLGVSAQAVSKWENGKCLPDTALLPEIAAVLGVSVDEILNPRNDAPQGFRLLSAYYGIGSKQRDVMHILRQYSFFDQREMHVNNGMFLGSPEADGLEYLTLVYQNESGVHMITCPEGGALRYSDGGKIISTEDEMTKLILIEGIPGSGKTVIAGKIAEHYRALGKAVDLYLEGPQHPADLGWTACIPIAQYPALLEKHAPLREEIKRNATLEGGYALVKYMKVDGGDKAFQDEMEAFCVYEGRVPDDTFFEMHCNRWRAFGKSAAKSDTLTIFESALLQMHVNELLFWRDTSEEKLIAHCKRLADMVRPLSPVLIYLSQPDIWQTIQRAAQERVAPGGDWIDYVIAYCENSPFGKQHGIKGFDGAMQFFALRKALEMRILGQLGIPYVVIEDLDYNWDDVWQKIVAYLNSLSV